MSRHQDGFVRKTAQSAQSGDSLSWVVETGRQGERLRAVADGTHLSTSERISYALELITNPTSRASIGRSEKQLKRYADGDDVPLSVLVAISALSGLPIDWIVSGRSKSDDEVRAWLAGEPLPTDQRGGTNPSETDVTRVPLIRFSEPSSTGDIGSQVARPSTVPLPSALFESLGLDGAYARAVVAQGRSMEPTFSSGDLLLVDTSTDQRAALVDGCIYALFVGHALFIKRLRLSISGWILASDNRPHFPDEPIPDDAHVEIMGRVVWCGRKLP